MIKPKKSLGQNFLQDKNISRKIVDSLVLHSGELVLEIGPGMGALTVFLLEKDCRFVAVDTDARVIEVLKEKYLKHNFELLHSDIRLVNLPDLMKKYDATKIKIIGNIPYNISSDISFWLFENSLLIECAVIMFQKEVAQRFAAKTRTKDYGILTVAANLCGSAKILFDVSPHCFYPKPEVTSSVIKFEFFSEKNENFDEIMTLVKSAFNQRRKTLRNALKNYIKEKTGRTFEELTNSLEIDEKNRNFISSILSKRAEELDVNDYIELYRILKM